MEKINLTGFQRTYLLPLLFLIILINSNLKGQEIENQCYHNITDTIYTIVIECKGTQDSHYFIETKTCADSIKQLSIPSVIDLNSYFNSKIPNEGVLLKEKTVLYEYENWLQRNHDSDDIIIFIGKVNALRNEFCFRNRFKQVLKGIVDFLKQRNYKVVYDGEFNETIKIAMKQYCNDTGLPVHSIVYNIEKAFELNTDKIDLDFCKCLSFD